MRKLILTIFLAATFVSCDTARAIFSGGGNAMDWPLFRGDESLSGYTRHSLPKQPTLRWSHKSGVRTISSPVVKGGETYWCDVKGVVRGVNIEGEESFRFDLGTPVEATPLLHNENLYIGTIDGRLTALSLSERDTLWSYATEGQISASPNKVDFDGREAIIFGSYDNYLYCVDSDSGEHLARFESGYYINGAVAVSGGYALFGGCDAWMRVIDCTSGVMVDSLQMEGYIPSSPAIDDERAYVGDYTGNIFEFSLKDGRIVDQRTIISAGDGGEYVSVPAVSPTTIYILTSDKYLHAIDRRDGTLRWRYLLKGNVGESSPVVADDRVIVCTKTGVVTILDAESGEMMWEYDTGEQIVSSPAVVKDHFFILTSRGTLFCFGDEA